MLTTPCVRRETHQILKPLVCPLPKVRHLGPESQMRPVTSPTTLGTSWEFHQPIFNLISEPGGAARKMYLGLLLLWHHLVILSSKSTSQFFLLFPSAAPQDCAGLWHLPARFPTSSPFKHHDVPYKPGYLPLKVSQSTHPNTLYLSAFPSTGS